MTAGRVIVVDDDPVLRRRIASTVAADPGLSVVAQAETLAEALRLLPMQPDLWLVDLGLPDGSGRALIDSVRAQSPGSKILVLSVFEDRASVLGAVQAGADGYILKDMADAAVVEHVKATLAGESPISARAAAHLLGALRSGGSADAAPPEDNTPLLSPREKELLELLARGRSRREAARMIGISPHTEAEYLQNAYRKLRVNSRSEAVYEALQARLISLNAPKAD